MESLVDASPEADRRAEPRQAHALRAPDVRQLPGQQVEVEAMKWLIGFFVLLVLLFVALVVTAMLNDNDEDPDYG